MAKRSSKNKKLWLVTIAAALSVAAVLVPGSASAATPECGLPSGNKCLAIDNHLYENEQRSFPAMNSLAVRRQGASQPDWEISKCVNVSPGERLHLHKASDFLGKVSPGDTIFVQAWHERDCGGGEAVADWVKSDLVVPDDGLRYFWIELRRQL